VAAQKYDHRVFWKMPIEQRDGMPHEYVAKSLKLLERKIQKSLVLSSCWSFGPSDCISEISNILGYQFVPSRSKVFSNSEWNLSRNEAQMMKISQEAYGFDTCIMWIIPIALDTVDWL